MFFGCLGVITVVVVGLGIFFAWKGYEARQNKTEAEQIEHSRVEAFLDDLASLPSGEAGRKQAADAANQHGVNMIGYRSTGEVTEAVVRAFVAYEGFLALAGGYAVDMCSLTAVRGGGDTSVQDCRDAPAWDSSTWCEEPQWQAPHGTCWTWLDEA